MIQVCNICKHKDKIKKAKCSKSGCDVKYGWDTRLYCMDCKEFENVEIRNHEIPLEMY